MKTITLLNLTLFVFLVSLMGNTYAATSPETNQAVASHQSSRCDAACWRQRYYALKQEQLQLEKRCLRQREKNVQRRQRMRHKELRQAKLEQLRQQCANKDLTTASISDKSLCNVVNNHFAYGMPITDEQLGIN